MTQLEKVLQLQELGAKVRYLAIKLGERIREQRAKTQVLLI
jgi:hypothetical protein